MTKRNLAKLVKELGPDPADWIGKQVLLRAAPPGRPRTFVFTLYINGKVVRQGHYFNPGKPDTRTEFEYQAFGELPPAELEKKFRAWAKRCDFEVLN